MMRIIMDWINLSPSIFFKSDVLEIVWIEKDISYDHLRVFDCRIFIYIPEDERSKLDGKSKQYTFLGYVYDEFGYKL